MTSVNLRLLKWLVFVVLAVLVSTLAFRGYLSPDFLITLSMYC